MTQKIDKVYTSVLDWLRAGRDNPHATQVKDDRRQKAAERNRLFHKRLQATRQV